MPYYVRLENGKCIEKICHEKKPAGAGWMEVDDPENYEVYVEKPKTLLDYIKDPTHESIFTGQYGALIIELMRAGDFDAVEAYSGKVAGLNNLVSIAKADRLRAKI